MFDDLLERKRQEKAMQQAGRLPPGQSLTRGFPVLHYGHVPIYNNLDQWNFRIWGLVEQSRQWSWAEFNALPRYQVTLDLHCVTKWSKFDSLWQGVHLNDLITAGLVKLKPAAKFCIQHCEFGFTTNLPIEVMLQANFLLATHFDGQPLTPDHGYPLRGLMGAIAGQHTDADRYLWKGGKWLRGLEFVEEDQPGFWEQGGYSNSARIWQEERFWPALYVK